MRSLLNFRSGFELHLRINVAQPPFCPSRSYSQVVNTHLRVNHTDNNKHNKNQEVQRIFHMTKKWKQSWCHLRQEKVTLDFSFFEQDESCTLSAETDFLTFFYQLLFTGMSSRTAVLVAQNGMLVITADKGFAGEGPRVTSDSRRAICAQSGSEGFLQHVPSNLSWSEYYLWQAFLSKQPSLNPSWH